MILAPARRGHQVQNDELKKHIKTGPNSITGMNYVIFGYGQQEQRHQRYFVVENFPDEQIKKQKSQTVKECRKKSHRQNRDSKDVLSRCYKIGSKRFSSSIPVKKYGALSKVSDCDCIESFVGLIV